jgi:trimeric autotransporter adhesin
VTLGPSAALAGGAAQAAAASHGARLTTGTISTVAGGVGGPGPATRVSVVPCGVTYGGGRLYVADSAGAGVSPSGGSVREVSPQTARLTTVAGTGAFGPGGLRGPAARAWVSTCSVARDHSGNLLMPNGARIDVVAASTGTFYGQAMTAGHIYAIAGNGTPGFSGNNGLALSAEIAPRCVAVDAAGNLVIANGSGEVIQVVAAGTGTFYGRPMTAGYVYTVAGDGTEGFSGDGGPATSAELGYPTGVSVDGAGNLVESEGENNRVRVVAAATGTFYGRPMTAGDIYTVAGDGTGGGASGDGGPATAAAVGFPYGTAVDGSGNLVIASYFNIRVVAAVTGTFYRQAMTAGHIYTVAGNSRGADSGLGGPAGQAEFLEPQGAAAGADGTLAIADSGSSRVLVVPARSATLYGRPMTAGHVYDVAGDGTGGYSGDGGPGYQAEVDFPPSVAIDGAGNVLIADSSNRVRVVAAATGTFYGRAMTAGDIYTIAGNGGGGFSGDGGPALDAQVGAISVALTGRAMC